MHFSKIAISLLFLVPTALSLAVSPESSSNSLDQRDVTSTATPDSTPSTPQSDKIEPNAPFYSPYRPPGRPWYPPYRPPYCRWQPWRYECRRGGGYRPYEETSTTPSKRDEIVESSDLELNKRDVDADGFYGGGGYGGGYGYGYGRSMVTGEDGDMEGEDTGNEI